MRMYPLSMSAFARDLLTLCEDNIRSDPESPAAKDAAERIDAAFMALLKGFHWNTFEWALVVAQLEELSSSGTDVASAARTMTEREPRLAQHGQVLERALLAWRTDDAKWEATLRLLDAAGMYKTPRSDQGENPSEHLRSRWVGIRRSGIPLAFRPPPQRGGMMRLPNDLVNR